MLYRKVPKTGETLSILGFGCMRLPVKDNRIDQKRATYQVRYAIDQGVNYLDTAWPYHSGESEPFLGRALAGGYREKVKLATKLPSWMITTRQEMDDYLNEQLTRLDTDRIDYYLLHAMNGLLWDRLYELGVLDFLDKAKADGRIGNAGFSFHGKIEDFKRIVDAQPWEFCQIQYNYLDVEYQAGREGLRYAASRQLGVIIMEPLRGGTLGDPSPPPALEDIWKTAETPHTPTEWALRWLWNQPEVTLVLSGMNEEAHIDENLKIANQGLPDSLSPEELRTIGMAADRYRDIMRVNCTGCGYCKPCPQGVDIPNCFDVLNRFHMFKNEAETKFVYAVRMSGILSGENGYASQCVQCGECLEKCPQEIEIPDLLKEVVEIFEGSDLKDYVASAKQYFKIDEPE
ncbi:MAG: aldo/keto reductase [Desulfobacteraceae bacterium]|nr:aldo/keto reductase [Desulfobacteraceae bacterium]